MAIRATAFSFAALALLTTAACARFPDFGNETDGATRATTFPRILPIDALIAAAPPEAPEEPFNRTTSLTAKSQATSKTGLTDADRQRLHDAMANP